MRIVIINGPNLNLTGVREPEVYGPITFEAFLQSLQAQFAQHELVYFQSNHEGALIDKLHEVGFSADGIILNAGAYSHTSIALADAIAAIKTPVVEVHMSNIAAREPFRHHSHLTRVCVGQITGFGLGSYSLALMHFLSQSA
jgi:3-dehydroquinate dehydratase-2